MSAMGITCWSNSLRFAFQEEEQLAEQSVISSQSSQ